MDGLIIVLLIIGLVSRIGKKKKQEQNRKRQAGFNEAAELKREEKKPSPAKKIADALEMVESEAKQLKIPLPKPEVRRETKDAVVKAILRSGDSGLISQMNARSGAEAKQPAGEGQAFEKLNAQRLRPEEKHREGESRLEHAAHRARIAEEEARLHQQRTELQELRSMNLKKLRTAVVMGEVLGKPVALRGNTLGRCPRPRLGK